MENDFKDIIKNIDKELFNMEMADAKAEYTPLSEEIFIDAVEARGDKSEIVYIKDGCYYNVETSYSLYEWRRFMKTDVWIRAGEKINDGKRFWLIAQVRDISFRDFLSRYCSLEETVRFNQRINDMMVEQKQYLLRRIKELEGKYVDKLFSSQVAFKNMDDVFVKYIVERPLYPENVQAEIQRLDYALNNSKNTSHIGTLERVIRCLTEFDYSKKTVERDKNAIYKVLNEDVIGQSAVKTQIIDNILKG